MHKADFTVRKQTKDNNKLGIFLKILQPNKKNLCTDLCW